MAWWNDPGQLKIKDGKKDFEVLIFLENASVGKCRIVETKKLIKVKTIVCEEVGT
ncbi:MAG: hypothetical protein IID43_05150 [Planctomycetes bacterium]|nr:hypothetical protein [Planctomycetota bacterium]